MRILALCLLVVLSACGQGTEAPPQRTTADRLAAPPDAAYGQRLAQICRTCHEVAQGTGHRVGPNLWGVVGAPAAHHADFAYSAAMKRSGLVWNEESLDAYLANPQGFVPGNRMAYPGMPNEADRRDVIAYLETLSGPEEGAAP
ncbi:c-type cytochrome [Parvularcula dongshanensis]|uniref:Cytochrome c n=1 Tax=Parvularcula dongshanensis TaxID=1173995 RepID=A0A840I2D9_9PROT|nr:cytochrome c family protein [Parvularcula dongshanensis]MBB4658451.1 cytochrome c [Parvularcula dongshanensis]